MTDEIIEAVCAAVGERFEDSARIYTEYVEQGLEMPCFFIMAEKDSLTALRGGRYRKTVLCKVEYIPSDSLKPRAECEDVSFELFECLELIKLDNGDVLRGTDRSADYSDGILTFSVMFSFEVIHTSELAENEMAGLDSEVNYGKKRNG